jgi:hypothetical protein
MSDYPEPLEADPDSVVTALEVGASMWARGEHAEGMKWLRKAVDEAFEAGLDDRGLELSKCAAAIASLVPPPPSARPPSPTNAPPAVTSAAPPPVTATPPAIATAPLGAPVAPFKSTPATPAVAASVKPAATVTAPLTPVSAAPPKAASATPSPTELLDVERVSVEPVSEAPPAPARSAPPPTPRTAPPRTITTRTRSSRPPGIARAITTRPPPRAVRVDESVKPAPRSPSATPSAERPESVSPSLDVAARAALEDASTRVTVPSDLPSKIDVMAVPDETVKRVEEAREEVVEKPKFDRKFITPLAMPRTATPPRPLPIREFTPAAGVDVSGSNTRDASDILGESTSSAPPVAEPPEGATRPALSDGTAERAHGHRGLWTTTGAVRVAVAREGSRVTLRVYDGGPMHDNELEALLVATPEVERLFRMLDVEGTRRG